MCFKVDFIDFFRRSLRFCAILSDRFDHILIGEKIGIMMKIVKMGDFAQQNFPLRNDFFRLFSHPSSWPVREVRFGPPNFNRGLRFHGDMTETKSPIFTIFIKNINFFTDQDMIKAIAQNCAKTKAPTKKIDKVNFEAHVTRIIFHLLTLI